MFPIIKSPLAEHHPETIKSQILVRDAFCLVGYLMHEITREQFGIIISREVIISKFRLGHVADNFPPAFPFYWLFFPNYSRWF